MRINQLGVSVLSLVAVTVMLSSQVSAQFIFELDNASPFEGAGIGASLPITVDTTTVTATTVDVFAPEFDETFARTGATLSALNGDAVVTEANSNSLGVDNPSILDDDFFPVDGNGAGQENRDLNDGEGWVVRI